jgi:2-C-methyl-D-erythritol 4-phosphate cytidylyltransferase
MFRYGVLRDAIRNGDHATMTDESSAVEMAGYQPKLVPGHRDNIKITEPGDVELAQFYLESGACE